MTEAPELIGIVLAGGQSRRMGRDKGALSIAGESQVSRSRRLLRRFVRDVYVSLRAEQASAPAYAGLPQLVDMEGMEGPAVGFATAWASRPDAALLVLAVDMPLVDESVLGRLCAARDTAALATAFRHADGTPEPLCAIWEPRARAELATMARQAGTVSLRDLLRSGSATFLEPPEAQRLLSANDPGEHAALARRLEALACVPSAPGPEDSI